MDDVSDSGNRLFHKTRVATLANESTSRRETLAVDGSYLYSMNPSAPELVPFYAV